MLYQDFNFGSKKSKDEVAEWLRRWTANPLGFAREGSNPFFVVFFKIFIHLYDFSASDGKIFYFFIV